MSSEMGFYQGGLSMMDGPGGAIFANSIVVRFLEFCPGVDGDHFSRYIDCMGWRCPGGPNGGFWPQAKALKNGFHETYRKSTAHLTSDPPGDYYLNGGFSLCLDEKTLYTCLPSFPGHPARAQTKRNNGHPGKEEAAREKSHSGRKEGRAPKKEENCRKKGQQGKTVSHTGAKSNR